MHVLIHFAHDSSTKQTKISKVLHNKTVDVNLYKLYLPNGVATKTVGETTAVGKAVENINRK